MLLNKQVHAPRVVIQARRDPAAQAIANRSAARCCENCSVRCVLSCRTSDGPRQLRTGSCAVSGVAGPECVHLPQPVLRRDVSLREEQVILVGGINACGYTPWRASRRTVTGADKTRVEMEIAVEHRQEPHIRPGTQRENANDGEAPSSRASNHLHRPQEYARPAALAASWPGLRDVRSKLIGRACGCHLS